MIYIGRYGNVEQEAATVLIFGAFWMDDLRCPIYVEQPALFLQGNLSNYQNQEGFDDEFPFAAVLLCDIDA